MFKDPKEIHRECKVGIKETFYFRYEDIGLIKRIEYSCNCTDAKDEPGNSRIKVEYTPKPIPIHLKETGEYNTMLKLTVTYSDKEFTKDSVIELIIIVKVIQ